jgi:hypothetical protein
VCVGSECLCVGGCDCVSLLFVLCVGVLCCCAAVLFLLDCCCVCVTVVCCVRAFILP